MQAGKNSFLPKGSSETLIGWKSGKKHFFPSRGPNGGSVAMDSAVHDHRVNSHALSIRSHRGTKAV